MEYEGRGRDPGKRRKMEDGKRGGGGGHMIEARNVQE